MERGGRSSPMAAFDVEAGSGSSGSGSMALLRWRMERNGGLGPSQRGEWGVSPVGTEGEEVVAVLLTGTLGAL
jgi:hypothetical protein